MTVLFDRNVPKPLAKYLTNRHSSNRFRLGSLKNGELLQAGEAEGFQVMVTSDKNLEFQQNINNRKIALVVLPSGRWPLVMPQVEEIVEAVNNATPGSYHSVPFRARI